MLAAPLVRLLPPLLLTVAVEGAAVYAVCRRWRYVRCSAMGNLLTNPALNIAAAAAAAVFGRGGYITAAVLGELAAVAVEAAVYTYVCGLGLRRAAALSAFLNALSFAAGAIVFGL
uniref:Uncharacterized protein n=1 Tax=uncultured bacterium contig00006 TaxID=1181498 RepID=A0A806JZ71_9BACT|nr:hypothetical protein [uncultured bacterium contig00006]